MVDKVHLISCCSLIDGTSSNNRISDWDVSSGEYKSRPAEKAIAEEGA